jgi:CheY-specific phosphatase CheX
MTALTPNHWLEAIEASFAEIASTSFAVDHFEVTARHESPPPQMSGAYLGLLASDCSVQIGIAASMDCCRGLARALFQMSPGDTVPDGDVADAVCEVANMLGGGVQRRVRETSEVRLGLPTFFHGPVQPTDRLGVAVSEFRAGDMAGALLVVHPRSRR